MDAPHLVSSPPVLDAARVAAARLNRDCFCVTFDRAALCEALQHEAGDPEFCTNLIQTRPNLFSNAQVFLPQAAVEEMLRVVRAIEAVTGLPGYRDAVLSWAPEIARHSFGPLGAFMGYDFHLADDGPKLIEVNTNAGGAFLNAFLARAQRACCPEMERGAGSAGAEEFDAAVLRMFLHEFSLQRPSDRLGRVAIVDDQPENQYLYPEFILVQRFFEKHGIEAIIVDAEDLRYECDWLQAHGRPIDLVYNRLVDFSFEESRHAALRAAYLAEAVVVTPNPSVHALFADKRNLTLLSDQVALRAWGLEPDRLADLGTIPRTVVVTPGNADHLWVARKKLFFKPASGHGGKAVYRGDKLTKGVWAEISKGGYVAQDFAAPGERMIDIDGSREIRKVDVRLYTYDGQILHTAARLYQGQVTNFKTPGGGFAPVFAI